MTVVSPGAIADKRGTRATAAVLRSAEAPFSLEQVWLPPLAPEEVLVRIVGAGLCHTDLLVRNGIAGLPIVLGHEGSGVVEEVGSGVRNLIPGDHVVLSFDSCGTCARCHAGAPSYCASFGNLNTAGAAGDGAAATDQSGETVHHRWFGQSSFATYAIANTRNAVRVAQDLPLELLGPLGCGIQTGAGAVLNVLKTGPGDRIAVFGGGAVGLAGVLAARAAGASEIVVVEPNEFRRKQALELGATHALAPGPDLLTEIRDSCGWMDSTLDTTGAPEAIQAAVRALRPLGQCGVVSWRSAEPVVGPMDLVMEGRSLVGICEGNAQPALFIPRMLDMWRAGDFSFDRLIGTFPFDQIDAAERAAKDGSVIKPVLVM